jgi:hypothetical protein
MWWCEYMLLHAGLRLLTLSSSSLGSRTPSRNVWPWAALQQESIAPVSMGFYTTFMGIG